MNGAAGGIIAPVVGALLSVFVWMHKRGEQRKDRLEENLNKIENTVIELSVAAKTNCGLLKEQHEWMVSIDQKVNRLDKRLWDLYDRGRQ